MPYLCKSCNAQYSPPRNCCHCGADNTMVDSSFEELQKLREENYALKGEVQRLRTRLEFALKLP